MAEDRRSGKLAVILHADIAGSTALVQQDEHLAHERIQDTFRRFGETIKKYQGRVHELRGDALLAEFERVSDAVSAVLAFQAGQDDFNMQFNDNIRPTVRVGIAMGEVIIADGTLTGAGVVLAQRVEQLAEPGGLCITAAIHEALPQRMPFDQGDLGEQRLKGFEEQIRVYTVRLRPNATIPEPESLPQTEAEIPKLPDKPSIAVLPFTNMSGDPEQDYFSDGITEDIITALTHISGLLVVARNSTMVYKGQAVDVEQVGREQGVRYVLEGSVRKSGNRIRVTAQLLDATTGHHQWADRYDRDLDDVFAVQDDITHKIMVEMRVQVSVGEKARMFAGRTKSVAAWELLLHADELGTRFIREDNLEARRLVEAALEIDPFYASAWTELGWTHWQDVYCGWTESRELSEEKALEAAQKAIELEEDYPNALALLGFVHELKGEHDRAVELTEKAVALGPNNAEHTAEFAHALTFAGKADEAVEIFKRAIRLSPIYPAWYLVGLGRCYYSMNEMDLAISTFQEAIAMEPGSAFARIYLTSAFVEVGLMEDAKRVAREIISIERHFSATNWQGGPFKDITVKGKIIDNLIKSGLPG